jgi:hypothetical protein
VHKRCFYHTEIVIPDLECSTLSCHSYLSSLIYNGEAVTLTKTKTFANPGYTVLTLTVNGVELSRIADYLYKCRRLEIKFDALGMYLAALPFQLNPFASRSKGIFCSKHVTRALKAAGIKVISDLNENIVTPSKLYRVLHDKIPRDRMVVSGIQAEGSYGTGQLELCNTVVSEEPKQKRISFNKVLKALRLSCFHQDMHIFEKQVYIHTWNCHMHAIWLDYASTQLCKVSSTLRAQA